MKILLITDGIYPFITGGMQKHSYYLAKFLTQSNIDVCLVHCTEQSGQIDEKSLPEFVDFRHEHITFKTYHFPSTDRFPGHYVRENKQFSEVIFNDLKNQLDPFDLIYCQGFTGWKFILESEKGNLKIPVISNLHGYNMFQKAPSFKVKLEHYLLRGIAKRVSRKSDFVFSFGGKITEILKKIGVKDEQIIESPIGIESSWLVKSPQNRKNAIRKFVFIGRYERIKGIQELNRALQNLIHQKTGNFEFHFIGDIPAAHRITYPNITYHGKITEEKKIQQILQSSDILVCPSYSEGMPTVIMEAMASGLAIIGTDVGAINQQITDNGWLIPDSRVETIQAALESAIRISDQELTALKENSLARVERFFLWERVIQHKIGCLEGCLGGEGKVGASFDA
ncbi:MAG: glycosyltransferase family 4 protein [Bacteroidetes bacterium]|nr:glycosyltransferase family 4 protein [Bacteroidota bacterium]